MNTSRLFARLQIVALIVLLAIVTAGCAEVRRGVSWPALSTMTVDGETRLIIAYENQVEMLNPDDGRQIPMRDENGEALFDSEGRVIRWVVNGADFENAQFFAPPITSTSDGQDTLIFPTYNDKLLEFYTNDGRSVNTAGFPISDGVIAPIVVTEELIYVPYRSGDVVAFTPTADGYEEAWRVDTHEGVWASPLLQDGILYVTSIDHYLYAVNATTGEPVWDNPIDLEGAVASTPAYADGYLYIGSYSHKLYQISVDGYIENEYEGNNWIWSTPVIENGVLYYTDLSGYVYALDAFDLTQRWVTKAADRGIRPGPIVYGDHVIVASRNGILYWLNRETGVEDFQREVEGRPEILSDLLLIEANPDAGVPKTMIIIGSANLGHLVAAFTLDDNEQRWTYGR